ncbi:hypothetical protein PMZ80_003504 [Knufia obscura]|uniref:Uncharacterized protein n=2 Tax=Knufia TaxID=430999 RepID=A0AAN8EMK8_9EURO|nr:hypothetical protein PMZ80_003504 [Knufia obscura]KAK5958578.1 hypothetical protein OHC33_000421 [Knufia fluminis]
MAGRLLPPFLAIVAGVGIGLYTFEPVWQDVQRHQREERIRREADLGPNMLEVPVQQIQRREKEAGDLGTDADTGTRS